MSVYNYLVLQLWPYDTITSKSRFLYQFIFHKEKNVDSLVHMSLFKYDKIVRVNEKKN